MKLIEKHQKVFCFQNQTQYWSWEFREKITKQDSWGVFFWSLHFTWQKETRGSVKRPARSSKSMSKEFFSGIADRQAQWAHMNQVCSDLLLFCSCLLTRPHSHDWLKQPRSLAQTKTEAKDFRFGVYNIIAGFCLSRKRPQPLFAKGLVGDRDVKNEPVSRYCYRHCGYCSSPVRCDQKIHPRITHAPTPAPTTIPATFSTATRSPCLAIRVKRLALPLIFVDRDEKKNCQSSPDSEHYRRYRWSLILTHCSFVQENLTAHCSVAPCRKRLPSLGSIQAIKFPPFSYSDKLS